MKLLLIDNYDSFTYNLEHYLSALGCEVNVQRNREIDLNSITQYDGVVLSPGPGLPKNAGLCMEVIEQFSDRIPILGICLGAQAIAQHFGSEIYNQKEVAHGISRVVHREKESWLLEGLEDSFSVGLYHSWAIKPMNGFSQHFKTAALRGNGVLMAFESYQSALAGVQFHPESIMTEGGREILNNWLRRAASFSQEIKKPR